MVTRYQRLAELPMKAPQPSGQLLELWCEDQRGTYVIPYSATGSRVDGVQSSPGSKFRRKSSVGGRVPNAAHSERRDMSDCLHCDINELVTPTWVI